MQIRPLLVFSFHFRDKNENCEWVYIHWKFLRKLLEETICNSARIPALSAFFSDSSIYTFSSKYLFTTNIRFLEYKSRDTSRQRQCFESGIEEIENVGFCGVLQEIQEFEKFTNEMIKTCILGIKRFILRKTCTFTRQWIKI